MKIVIIGYGVVGHNMHKEFPDADIIDPAKGYEDTGEMYNVGFVCVPTDPKEDGSANIEAVRLVCSKYAYRCGVLVIKSTVPPGTTKDLLPNCVFSPEYYGATVHANSPGYDFVILGGDRDHTTEVAELYKSRKTGDFRIFKTDSKTAEYVKHMENFWLAMKVTFVNAFCQAAEEDDVDRDELRELWLLDPRVNRSHTFSFRDQPFYDSHCFNKDPLAFCKYLESTDKKSEFLESVIKENKRMKEQ